MKYLIPIIIIMGLVFLAGCQVQTQTKYQCANGEVVDSLNDCPSQPSTEATKSNSNNQDKQISNDTIIEETNRNDISDENRLKNIMNLIENEIDKLEENRENIEESDIEYIKDKIEEYDEMISNIDKSSEYHVNKVENFNNRVSKLLKSDEEQAINKEGINPPRITKIIDGLGNEYNFDDDGRNDNPIRPKVKVGDHISFTVYSQDPDSENVQYEYYTNGRNHFGWTTENEWTWDVSLDDFKETTTVFFFVKDNNDIYYHSGVDADQEIHLHYVVELD